jgi:hypothetical protein
LPDFSNFPLSGILQRARIAFAVFGSSNVSSGGAVTNCASFAELKEGARDCDRGSQTPAN